MKRSTTCKKLIALTLMVAIVFGVYTALPPRYGSALSAMATDLTVATMTDIPLTPMVPEEENAVTSITPNPNQMTQNNVAVKVVVNNSNIDHCTLRISLTNGLRFYGFRPGSITAQRANNMISLSNGYIYLNIVSTDNFTQGTHLLTFYFTADTTFAYPQTSWASTVIECISDTGASIINPFVLTVALIGDANLSGEVDTADATWISRYAVNSLTESDIINLERQCLAADVDLNGAVEMADYLPVLNRIVSKVKSFLDINRIYNPYGTSVGQAHYQIKSVQTGRYLRRTANNTLGLGASTTSLNGLFQFEKANSNYSLYRIVSKTDDQELCLDTSNNLVLSNSGATIKASSMYWHIIPKGSKYIIMNSTLVQQTLGDLGRTTNLSQCGMSYLDYGNVWEIIPYINLKIYYDGAYAARHTNQTAMQNELVTIRNEIATIIQNAFGVTITTTAVPTAHTSLLDTVHGVGNRNNLCSCSGKDPEICKGYNSSSSIPSVAVHHSNASAQLHDFIGGETESINYHLLYSGYKNCGGKTENGVTSHINNKVAGIANVTGAQRAIAFYIDNANEWYRKKLTALHELCHLLGAKYGTNKTPDTNHGDCVMSYDRNSSTLLNLWNLAIDDDPTVADETRIAASKALFCEGCTQLINDYL